jgi:PEP-CTERM motif
LSKDQEKMKRSFLMSLLGATAMIGAAMASMPNDAHAALITQGGDSFSVNFLLAAGATDPNGGTNALGQDISAKADFYVDSFDLATNKIKLKVTFENTSANAGKEIGFYMLGIGTDPNATSVTFQQIGNMDESNKFSSAALGAPGGANSFPDKALIDVTSMTGPGAPRTLREGQSDAFFLTIGFAPNSIANGINIDPFNVFVQTKKGSFHFGGSVPPPTDVPEPASLAIFGVGLLGLGYAARRRKHGV